MNSQIEEDLVLLKKMYQDKKIDKLHLSAIEFIIYNKTTPTPEKVYEHLERILIPEEFKIYKGIARKTKFYIENIKIFKKNYIKEKEIVKDNSILKPNELERLGFNNITYEELVEMNDFFSSVALVNEVLRPFIEKEFLRVSTKNDPYYQPLNILKKESLIKYVEYLNMK